MTYFKLILTTFLWGGTFIAGKGIAGNVDPYCAAFLRFAIASVFLIFLTRKTHGHLPSINKGQAVNIFFLGLSGVFAYNILFFTGLCSINANRASLIIATNPIFISLFSVLLFKDKLSFLKIVGLGLSVGGALLVISSGHFSNIFKTGIGKGELAIFGCVVAWVAYSLMGKPLMKSLSPMASVCYAAIAGTIMLFFPALAHGLFSNLPSYGLTDWANLFYLGFFGTVLGFFWYYEGIQKIGPMKAGVFINFVPIFAIILSYFFLKEPVTREILAGGFLVISGVYLTNSSGFKATVAPCKQ
ncbi:MAG: EamA family transporter [Desulfobacteraceae bacterium]|nr:EamA family transporter [Desulfobacteraceae bacterium]